MIPNGCVEKCRGCKHREWSKADSLNQKFEFLRMRLSQWDYAIESVRSVSDELRWGYRSKTTMSTHFDGSEWRFGMWSRDELISIPNCPIHSAKINQTMSLIRNAIPKSHNFRLVFVVQSSAQVVLVVKSKQIPDISWLTGDLKKEFTKLGIEGVWIHLNPSAGKRIFEKNGWHLIFGKSRSVDFNGLLYGPAAFQQLVPDLYNQSLKEAQRFFGVTCNDAIVDLYCGTGNSMKKWVNSNANVLGIELGGDAVECAKINIPKATVLRGACRQRVPQIASWARAQANLGRRVLLYANPPRTGLELEVLDWIVDEGNPAKIAYLSCSPGTLSKNLQALVLRGYAVSKLIPFDFFPQTIHVECLALLEKQIQL